MSRKILFGVVWLLALGALTAQFAAATPNPQRPGFGKKPAGPVVKKAAGPVVPAERLVNEWTGKDACGCTVITRLYTQGAKLILQVHTDCPGPPRAITGTRYTFDATNPALGWVPGPGGMAGDPTK